MDYRTIREMLEPYIAMGKREFIIFPYGEIGMLVKRILNEGFGLPEAMVVDNGLCRYNSTIKDFSYLKDYLAGPDGGEAYVIFASGRIGLLKKLQEYIPEERIIAVVPIPFPDARASYGPLMTDGYHIKSIGSFCSFAPGTAAVWNHPLDMVTNHAFLYNTVHAPQINRQKVKAAEINKKYVIGNDVWLGENVILTNGVRIGNGVRAAAGSVITKDVPDYAIVAGVPARIIKYRFTAEQIEKLNEIAWWDWPYEKINECYDDFLDIERFLQKHYPPKNIQKIEAGGGSSR